MADGLIIFGVLALALTLNFSRIMRAGYDHDEDQFIASARLLVDHSLLPYQDYPYFHTPYLTMVYAIIFSLTGHYNLLAARAFSLLCGLAAVLVLMLVTRDLFRRHPARIRWWAVAAVALLLLPNPLFADANQRAWNHSFPVLFTLLAFLACYTWARRKRSAWWLFAAGVCLGVAVGARLSFLTALPAFLAALLFYAPSSPSRLRSLLSFCIGFLVALIPLLIFLLASPDRFFFGNLAYPQLNTLYRFDVPPVEAPMDLSEKTGFVWNNVIAQPATLLLFFSFLVGASMLGYRLCRRRGPRFEMALVLLIAPFVVIGSFLPTPSWSQYFYAPVVFALIAISFGLAYLSRPGGNLARWVIVAFTELVVLANLYGLEDYRRMSFVLHPEAWRPLMFHSVGDEVRAAVGDGSANTTPRVLTLAPLYPLEAGLDIYPAFATGPFAWRIAPYLDADRRKALGVVSAADLGAYLSEFPPDGILVGVNSRLEKDLIQYAKQHGYHAVDIASHLRIWVRPGEGPP